MKLVHHFVFFEKTALSGGHRHARGFAFLPLIWGMIYLRLAPDRREQDDRPTVFASAKRTYHVGEANISHREAVYHIRRSRIYHVCEANTPRARPYHIRRSRIYRAEHREAYRVQALPEHIAPAKRAYRVGGANISRARPYHIRRSRIYRAEHSEAYRVRALPEHIAPAERAYRVGEANCFYSARILARSSAACFGCGS